MITSTFVARLILLPRPSAVAIAVQVLLGDPSDPSCRFGGYTTWFQGADLDINRILQIPI